MIQNILALIIVFIAAAYTVYATVKSLMAKKSSACGGCNGCSFKDGKLSKQGCSPAQSSKFQVRKLDIGVKQIK